MRAIKAVGLVLVAGISRAASEGPFILPPLPYEFDALEPHFDKETMQIHHDKHHATYVAGLNAAAGDNKGDAQSLAAFQKDAISKGIASRNHGGGHYNHALFWVNLAPVGSGGDPSVPLDAAIVKAFGSFSDMQKEFAKAAMGRFGSGWAWLGVKEGGGLAITSTANQDNPLMDNLGYDCVKMIPILGLDVWEHAYYLKYQNKRPDYVGAFWNIVNWQKVSRSYEVYATKGQPVPPTPTGAGHAIEL